MSAISTLSSTYWQSLLGLNSQTINSSSGSSCASSAASSSSATADNVQLSPFAVDLLGTLQQLQQANPTEYKSAMSQISSNLENASTTATADGNTTAANELSQLATDFTSAGQSGDLPNIQDLLQALGNSGNVSSSAYGPPAFFSPDVSASSTTGSTSSATSSASATASNSSSTVDDITAEILASLQASNNMSASLNPMNIIMETLSNTGAIDSNS